MKRTFCIFFLCGSFCFILQDVWGETWPIDTTSVGVAGGNGDTPSQPSSQDGSLMGFFLVLSLLLNAFLIYVLFVSKKSQTKKNNSNVIGAQPSKKKKRGENVPKVDDVVTSNGNVVEKTIVSAEKRKPDSHVKVDIQEKRNEEPLEVKPKVPKTPVLTKFETKYATIQEGGSTGLRIAFRSLSDSPENKMFKVMISLNDDSATYTFVPSMEKEIMKDLQTFKTFTEPFIPKPTASKLIEVSPGQLVKEGSFWIVTKKLKVDLI